MFMLNWCLSLSLPSRRAREARLNVRYRKSRLELRVSGRGSRDAPVCSRRRVFFASANQILAISDAR